MFTAGLLINRGRGGGGEASASSQTPFPVTRVCCDVDEAPSWCSQGVLTYYAGLRAAEWDLAQDDEGGE